MNFAGKFIVLDGPDGCGKTTQAKRLAKWVESQGFETAMFRDPGDTKIGESIREILLSKESEGMDDKVEVMLYMAARCQLWKEKIKPALEAGKCVIMDRWLSSTCAYQGHAGKVGIKNVINLASDCLERNWPDVTLILDVDLETSKSRMQRSLDRMEAKGDEYHSLVRQGYLSLAQISRQSLITANIGVIDAKLEEDAVFGSVLNSLNISFKYQ